MNRSEDVDDLDLVVFGASCCASLASRSSPLIHQRVAWLQWYVFMVLALPKVSGSKEAPVLRVDDQSGLFLWLHSTRSFLSIPWRWHHGSSNLVASSIGQHQIINFCAQGPPNILRYRHHFLHCLLLPLLRWIPWSSCAEHVPKFYSMESLIKLPFQRVVIDPKRTPDEELMVVLLQHYALSRDISERAVL